MVKSRVKLALEPLPDRIPGKVVGFFKGQPGEGVCFGFIEYEIDQAILDKHAKVLSVSNLDIWTPFSSQLGRKVRELLGI